MEYEYKVVSARCIGPHKPLQLQGLIKICLLQLDHVHFFCINKR